MKKEEEEECVRTLFSHIAPMVFSTCSPVVNKLFLYPEKKGVGRVAISAGIRLFPGHWQIGGVLMCLSEPKR
jgi:hypothetical protein